MNDVIPDVRMRVDGYLGSRMGPRVKELRDICEHYTKAAPNEWRAAWLMSQTYCESAMKLLGVK